MRTLNLTALLTAVLALSAASLFAEDRHYDRTSRDGWGASDRRLVTIEGRIRDIDRERNGFVIRLDRGGERLFAPIDTEVRRVSTVRQRTSLRDLERGDYIRAKGSYGARGVLQVYSIDLLRADNRRDDRRISGIVEAVDRHRGMLWLRDERSGRTTAIEMDRSERRQSGFGYDFVDIRRGDRVTVRGEWRNGRFFAYDIDLTLQGRW